MKAIGNWIRVQKTVLVVALIIFLLKALYLLCTPADVIPMLSWIIDDSYITMRVARNIGLGYGFSFNGINLTTGVSPLWAYLTSVFHILFSVDGAMKATIIFSALCASVAALVTYFIARRISDDKLVPWVAFVLVSFSGNAFFQGMNGMETSFFTLFVLLSVGMFFGMGTDAIRSSFLRGCIVGIPAGIALLVRGDGIFIAFAVGCMFLWQCITDHAGRKDRIRATVGYSLIVLSFFAALLGWQMVQTGSLFLSNQVGRREIALAAHGVLEGGIAPVKYLRIVAWNIFQLEELLSIALCSSILVFIALLWGLQHRETRQLSYVIIIYCIAFFGVLVVYQWYFPDAHGLRYINPAIHLLCIPLSALLCTIFARFRILLVISILTLVVLSTYLLSDYFNGMKWARDLVFFGRPSAEKQERFWAPFRWARENIPEGSIVGVRDHGRFALFTDLPVQDLAGIIDPMVTIKLKEGGVAFRDYLKEKNVEYLFIPSPEQRYDLLYKMLHESLTLEDFPDAPGTFNQTFYHIRWDKMNM